MADLGKIIIKVAIPETGSPSVYEAKACTRDSAGEVWRSMNKSERLLCARALVSFIGYLLE